MPIVDESKQNKGVNNNTRNKQMAKYGVLEQTKSSQI